MKIPYFEETWKDKPINDKQTIKRNNVFVLLKHAEKDEFCLLNWKKFWWKSFIIWWVDENENLFDAAKREVIEETWYNDFWTIKVLDFNIHTQFYAHHKNVNRYSIENYVYIELKSKNNIWVKEEEVVNHDFVWIKKQEVEKFINLNNNLYAWRLFSTWKEEDIEYLKTLDTFNGFI